MLEVEYFLVLLSVMKHIVLPVGHTNILSCPLGLLNMKFILYAAQYSCFPNRKMYLYSPKLSSLFFTCVNIPLTAATFQGLQTFAGPLGQQPIFGWPFRPAIDLVRPVAAHRLLSYLSI